MCANYIDLCQKDALFPTTDTIARDICYDDETTPDERKVAPRSTVGITGLADPSLSCLLGIDMSAAIVIMLLCGLEALDVRLVIVLQSRGSFTNSNRLNAIILVFQVEVIGLAILGPGEHRRNYPG